MERPQPGELADLSGNLGELIAGDMERLQPGELANLSRKLGELVVGKDKLPQARELAQHGEQGEAQRAQSQAGEIEPPEISLLIIVASLCFTSLRPGRNQPDELRYKIGISVL